MKQINCPFEDYELTFHDEGGNEVIVKHEAKDWDFSHWINPATKEGIKQRVHEEEFLLGGEVINSDAGVDWDYFFDNIELFTSNEPIESEGIKSLLKQQLYTNISRINEVLEVSGVIIDNAIKEGRIVVHIVLIYEDENGEQKLLTI